MGETIRIVSNPHPDIELGIDREPVEYLLTLPEAGINSETGVIMAIPGLGEYTESNYQMNELRPYLANKLNCIAVGVNYFGILRNSQIQILPSFLYNMNRIYRLNLSMDSFAGAQKAVDIYRAMAEPVVKMGVTSLDIRCQPQLITGRGEYQSWGFMPAIDCLQVLGEVLNRYNLNRKKIIAFGNGYGGYIAMLMAKYAPHTFSLIVEREAYSRVELKHVVSGELIEPDHIFAFDIEGTGLKFTIASTCNNPWTIEDESSPQYFSDSHRQIRSLLLAKHRVKSETAYYMLHSSQNGYSSITDKDQCVALLRDFNLVVYNRISDESYQPETDQGFFDNLLEKADLKWEKSSIDNDFSKENKYLFYCADKVYQFDYGQDGSIQVSREDISESR